MPENNAIAPDSIRAIIWRDSHLALLDQRRLPAATVYLELDSANAVADAIRDMVVRGAPAIGITAAFGVVLAARRAWREHGDAWREAMPVQLEYLAGARPTAVNLGWALRRMQRRFDTIRGDPETALLDEARAIHAGDIAANRRMGDLGAALIEADSGVITHCNTGSLATGGYGTALGVVRSGWQAGRIRKVYADETRPWLQGARLTAWELVGDGIPVTLIADGAAAHIMSGGGIGWIIVGSDRIAANGDVANKIGTYHLAIAARHHGVRCMVVAPTSTIDMTIADGAAIPIEQRAPEEVLTVAGQPMAAAGADAENPAFDVTPAALVDAIVTEKGVVLAPTREKMQALMKAPNPPA